VGRFRVQHYRSTVDTTGRLKSHIYDIICGTSKCVNEFRERLAKSATLLFASGFGVGAISWLGHMAEITFSLVIVVLLGLARKRKDAFLRMLCYYAGATWQIIPGASVFFEHHANAVQIVLLWLALSTVLAAPWAALWFHKARLRLYAVPLAFLLLTVPPLGIISCASPLTAAGL